jgi:hypothetical protein
MRAYLSWERERLWACVPGRAPHVVQPAAIAHVVLDTCSHPPAHLRRSTSLQTPIQRRHAVAVWSAGEQNRPEEDEQGAERVGGALAGELFKTRSARVMRRPAVEAQMAAAQEAMAAVRARVELRDLDGARSARVMANREAMLAGTCRSYVARCELVRRAADGLRRLFPRGGLPLLLWLRLRRTAGIVMRCWTACLLQDTASTFGRSPT